LPFYLSEWAGVEALPASDDRERYGGGPGEASRYIPTPVRSDVTQLEAGEAQILSAPVTWIGPPFPRQGTLTLTNHALLFEGPIPAGGGGGGGGGGMGRPMMRPGFRGPMGMGPRGGGGGPPPMQPGTLRIPLWRCRGATVVPNPQGGGNLLQVQLLSRVIAFTLPQPEAWAAAVVQARASAPPAPPGGMGPGGGPGGRPMPRCDYCGRLSPAGSPKCENCGAPF
jgi:hypothetical protein